MEEKKEVYYKIQCSDGSWITGTCYVENLAPMDVKVNKQGKVIKVLSYLDTRTGEIISTQDISIGSIRPDFMLEREKRLNALRKESREFASFICKFRNQACGFLVPLDTIIKMYSVYKNKEVKNVKRLIPALIKGKILDENFALDEVFMILNKHATKGMHKGDQFRAYVIFTRMMLSEGKKVKESKHFKSDLFAHFEEG